MKANNYMYMQITLIYITGFDSIGQRNKNATACYTHLSFDSFILTDQIYVGSIFIIHQYSKFSCVNDADLQHTSITIWRPKQSIYNHNTGMI